MADRNVLDAHTLVWYIEDNPRLGAAALALLDDPAERFYLPVIALAEACHTVARGRTTIPSVGHLLADLDADPRITVVPLDREVLDLSLPLAAVQEMHDRLIVATTLSLQAPDQSVALLSCDVNITASALVPMIW
jgi:PIN domain nuclease of toxin-antitoxin system